MTLMDIPAGPLSIARGLVAKALNRAVAWGVAFVALFFGERQIRGVDIGLCVISTGWVWAITANPDVMGRLASAGVSYLSQQALVLLFAGLAACHLIGALTPEARTFRKLTLSVAGWVWIVIGAFMSRAVTTGGPTYLVVGAVAWLAVAHLARRRE